MSFDVIALIFSSIYFIIFAVYNLFIILKNNDLLDFNVKIFAGLLLMSLILPIIYFIKQIHVSNKKLITAKYQKMILTLYFIVVFVSYILLLAGIKDDNKYLLYLKLYILPLLVLFSLYLIYESVKYTKYDTFSLLLNVLLAFLYYTALYDTIYEFVTDRHNDYLLGFIFVLSVALSYVFLKNAYNMYKA